MNAQDITQLTIGGVAITGMVVIVKYFISFIKLQEKNTNRMVSNHINHNTQAIMGYEKSNNRLASAIESLIVFLKEKLK